MSLQIERPPYFETLTLEQEAMLVNQYSAARANVRAKKGKITDLSDQQIRAQVVTFFNSQMSSSGSEQVNVSQLHQYLKAVTAAYVKYINKQITRKQKGQPS